MTCFRCGGSGATPRKHQYGISSQDQRGYVELCDACFVLARQLHRPGSLAYWTFRDACKTPPPASRNRPYGIVQVGGR